MSEQPTPNAGPAAFDAFMTERRILDRVAAKKMGVSRQTVQSWRAGTKPPTPVHRRRIEIFCAKVHPRTLKPIKTAGGRFESHCPRELWQAEQQEEAALAEVQPYDAVVAAALAAGAP